MSQTPSQIVDNIKTALPAIANAIKGNWDNIQSLNIKTNSSVSLPIWSCTLDGAEGGRWNGLQLEEEEVLEMDGEESDAEEVKPQKGPTSKGRKRSSSSDEEEEKPKKKTKTTDISSTTKPKIPSVAKSSKLASAEVDSPIKKRKVTEQSLNPLKAPSAVELSTPSSKKAQKAKPASTAATEPISSKSDKSSANSKSVEKEKKKPQSSAVPSQSSAPIIDAPLKKKKIADPPPSSKPGPSPTIADTITPSAGRDKSGKEKKKISKLPEAAPPPTAPERSIKPSLTKEEFKQKRASVSGEKKKEIISKVKGGRSAKNAVLGKKVSQV